jgi:hypothetical protein
MDAGMRRPLIGRFKRPGSDSMKQDTPQAMDL